MREREGSTCYLTEDTFDDVPISAAFVSKSQVESIECVLETVCVVDEKRHVRDVLFLAEFTTEQRGELRRPRLKQPHVEELVRVGIDRRKQPVAPAVDADQRLVYRDCFG